MLKETDATIAEDTRIEGGIVIPMTGAEDVFYEGTVSCCSGYISYAGPSQGAPKGSESARIIDARGKIVLPGFINTHCHTAMTLMRGYADDMVLKDWLEKKVWPFEARMREDDIYWGTCLGAYEMLSGGITTVLDMYGHSKTVIQAFTDMGIRAIIAPGIRDVGRYEPVSEQLAKVEDLYNQHNNYDEGRLRLMIGPHATYTCTIESLLACAELAKKLEVGLHIHLHETEEEVERSWKRDGESPIGLLHRLDILNTNRVVAAHCVHIDMRDIEILSQTETGVCHCPVSNLKLASGIAPIELLKKNKISVGLGTDGAASDNVLQLLGSELRLAALLTKNEGGDPSSFTSYDALEMATIGGARVLGMSSEIGSLEQGKRADITIIDVDRPHLLPVHDPVSAVVYSAFPGDVEMTLVGGKVVYSEDAQELISEKVIKKNAIAAAIRLSS